MVALFMLKEVVCVCEGGTLRLQLGLPQLSAEQQIVEEVQVDGRYAVQIQEGEGRKVGVNG